MTKIVDMGGYEMHHPPEKLKNKVSMDGALSIAEMERRAAEQIEALTGQFLEGLSANILTINDCLARINDDGTTPEIQETIFRNAHDMKGMGGSFGYPIVGVIGAGLSDLTHEKIELPALNVPLIKAHMDVLRWIVDQKIQNVDDPRATPLLAALEEAKIKFDASDASGT